MGEGRERGLVAAVAAEEYGSYYEDCETEDCDTDSKYDGLGAAVDR